MKSCFNSEMIITQNFDNDFWIRLNDLSSIFYIENLLRSGNEIQYTKKNQPFIQVGSQIIYIESYYKKYNLKGHNGIDVIPKNKNNKKIYNMIPGKIMILKERGAYGNSIAIWNKNLKLTEYHNHLYHYNFDLKLYQYIPAGTFLGIMGNTGHCVGTHNHLAYAYTDDQANRINRDNGYNGYVDPIAILTMII